MLNEKIIQLLRELFQIHSVLPLIRANVGREASVMVERRENEFFIFHLKNVF